MDTEDRTDVGLTLIVTPAGRSPQEWDPVHQAAAWLTVADLAAGPDPDRPPMLLAVSAHPDDETIGAGLLLAAWTAAGHPSAAVLGSAGEACLDHVAVRPPDLAQRRLAEWEAALDELGVGPRYLLGHPDGRLGAHEDAVADEVSDLVERFAARHRVILVAPHAADPHPDHQAVGRAAARAAAATGSDLLGYPVWMSYWSDPALAPSGLRLETDDVALARRDAAVRCFATQFEPLGPGLDPVVPAALLDHHREQLLFPLASGPVVSR